MSVVRTDCYWYLGYGGRSYCKKKTVMSPPAELVPLDLGCPDGCPDLDPVEWRKPKGPPPKAQLEELEWEEDEEDTNVGGRDR